MKKVRILNNNIAVIALNGNNSQVVKVVDLNEEDNKLLVKFCNMTFTVTVDDIYPNVYVDDYIKIYI